MAAERMPGRQESRPNQTEGNQGTRTFEAVGTPPQSPQDAERIAQARQNLSQNTPPNTTSHEAPAAHTEHHGGHHHKENFFVGSGKNIFAFFGLLMSWSWQALKRAPEMAGKGGGGGAKKDDHGHGGGGHH